MQACNNKQERCQAHGVHDANDLTPEDVASPDKEIAFPESVVSMMRGALGYPTDGFPSAIQQRILKGQTPVEGRVGASAFANSNLDAYLRANGIRHVYLAGYASHVCVESTLRDAHDRGVEATVITDATAAFTQPQFDHFVNDVIHHFGHATTAGAFAKDLAR